MKVELTIRKEGEEWCLYTADGDRKLGCHPTREAAEAQEAAIKARVDQASKLVPEVIKEPKRSIRILNVAAAIAAAAADDEPAVRREPLLCSREQTIKLSAAIKDSPSIIQEFDNGDVLVEAALLQIGDDFINGGSKFSVTEDGLKTAIKNFEARGIELPVTIGHVQESGAPAAAWIVKLFMKSGDQKLWTHMRILKRTWEEVVEGRWKYLSAEFWTNGLDVHGKEIGMDVDGAAITNKPFLPMPIVSQEAARRGECLITLSKFSGPPAGASGRSNVADDKKKDDVKVDGERVSLSKTHYDALVQAQEQSEQRGAELEETKGKLIQSEKNLERERTHNLAQRVRIAATRLQSDGVVLQLGDFAIDSSDSDCLAWLSSSPFGVTTIEGLEKLCRDEEASRHLPRVKLNAAVSGGTDRQPPLDLTTEPGRAEAVRRRVAQIRREFKKDELEFMLSRRKMTVEDFARAELTHENPGVKFPAKA